MCAAQASWREQSLPAFDVGPDGFPCPGQVIRYFRQIRFKVDGKPWTQRDLAQILGKQELAIREMELRDTGLSDIPRRRFLAELFGIPPGLLGLATMPETGNMNAVASIWWVQQGFPAFDAGSDGFPRPGQVIRHFRRTKLKADGKPWTQRDVAQVLGLQELAIREMELRDTSLNDISRRRVLAELLDISPILLGLAEVPQEEPDHQMTTSSVNKNGLIDLAFYEVQLDNYYNAHHRLASYKHLLDIQNAIAALYQVLPFSSEKGIWQLLSRYHIMIASIMRDQGLFCEALEHLDRAIHLTKRIDDVEFLADALYRQGWVYLEQREGQKAAQCFLSAEMLLKKLPSYMGGGILIGLGRALAIQPQDAQERMMALRTLDKAANILRISAPPPGNHHYLEIELDRYHLDKSAAFLDIGSPREALRELSSVRCSMNNQRRAALISALQAQAYFSLGKYTAACSLAEESLEFIDPIRSVVNYERIKTLHKQLEVTEFGNDPEVARIGVLLHQIHLHWYGKNRGRKV